ncbi:MAG: TonB-dependent receptor plug domain-containing protein, partial [Cyclobacteriaceae bacterium]
SATYNNYQYDISSEANPVNAFAMDYDIEQSDIKLDFNYFPNTSHTIRFGATAIYYNLNPGSLKPFGQESLIEPLLMQRERGVESAIYLSDNYEVNRRLSLYMGLRYSMFHNIGPRQVYTYPEGLSKEVGIIQDTTSYASGEVINSYGGPEFRFSLRYLLAANSSLKVSYNRMRQYIHMLSNTTAISPTDTWKLSDSHVRPQIGDQYAIGYFRNMKNNTIEASVEAYYKTMQDFLDFKSGAILFLNPAIETDIINAYGKAYGIELMLKKMTGKLNGWLSYTYSRSFVQINKPETSDVINRGEFFPSNFDKPHDVTLVGNYRFSRRFSFSLNFTYSTGRPITLPQAKYSYEGSKRIHYSDRNQYRIPDYMRADIAFNLEGNHIIKKLNHSSWTLAVYNLLGRRNAYSVFFDSNNGVINGYQLSIFGQPIPTLTWNFKF